MGSAAILRARVEGILEARIPSALTPKIRHVQESMSCGVITDAFDPVSASQSGVVLNELLWIRCGFTPPQGRSLTPLEQALGAADLLLQSGGFGLLALDLGNVPENAVRRISLTTWFRFRRAVEETQTLFVVLGKQSSAGTSSTNVLDLSQSGIDIEENAISSKLQHIDGDCLIRTLHTRAEVVREQMRKPARSVRPIGEFSTSLHSYR
jgi:hypothetical protein